MLRIYKSSNIHRLPVHSWPQPSYGVQTLVSSHEKHKPDEVTRILPHHELHFDQGKPAKKRAFSLHGAWVNPYNLQYLILYLSGVNPIISEGI
jgi:hypothetical protein